MDRRLLFGLLAAAVLAAAGAWWLTRGAAPAPGLTLYGNVDLREVDLAFNNSERIGDVLVREGDKVKKGQAIATLDVARIEPELEQARANATLAQADLGNARRQYERLAQLWRASAGKGLSAQDLDSAKTAFTTAAARAKANAAQYALLRQQRADATLTAPMDATVRARLMEPGEMASPQRPVVALAITDPKWVRVYVSETDLGELRGGERAQITVDSFPGRSFSGWIGFISPTAEFTPKTVETPQLRTDLVYETRVFVNDPNDMLRLGMPATVHLPARAPARRTQ